MRIGPVSRCFFRLVLCQAALFPLGCASTRDLLREEVKTFRFQMTSSSAGTLAVVNKRSVGQPPLHLQGEYRVRQEEVVFGNYRTGLALVITSACGLATGTGMIVTGTQMDDHGLMGALIGLGAVGALYAIVGGIVGGVIMGTSSKPTTVTRTEPSSFQFGMNTTDRGYHEIVVEPIDPNLARIPFNEIQSVHYDSAADKWTVVNLLNLKFTKSK